MTILELREKRAKAWEAAKAFLDSHRNERGILSAEDDAAYTRMEQEITDLGKEIARMERQEAFERELSPAGESAPDRTSGIRAAWERKRPVALRRNTRPISGTPCAPRCRFPVWSTHWKRERIPRVGILCRMSMNVPWWKPWKRKMCSASWQM